MASLEKEEGGLLTNLAKGSFLRSRSVDFWYFLISLNATVPGLACLLGVDWPFCLTIHQIEADRIRNRVWQPLPSDSFNMAEFPIKEPSKDGPNEVSRHFHQV